MASSVVYLDYNATTPVADEVFEAMVPYLRQSYGNASSSHTLGLDAKRAVDQARAQIATMLQADSPSEILFLSGGTESINYAIKGSAAVEKHGRDRNHIITSCVEHVAVLETCRYLEGKGYEVTYVPVDEHGRVNVEDVIQAVKPSTFFISVMLANNEVGTVQPIAEITQRVKDIVASHPDEYSRVLFHTDASQAIGKIPVSVHDLGVDFLTIAGHKLYAPKGIGALYMRSSAPIPETLVHGASHEHGRRAGTENVPYIAGLGKACELVTQNISTYKTEMATRKSALFREIQAQLAGAGVELRVNGHPEHVLPNTLSLSYKDISAIQLLQMIEGQSVYASAGSACHSHHGEEEVKPSAVLTAMKVPIEFALGTLRLSVGRETSDSDIKHAATVIAQSVRDLAG
ncbi:hypothetical protein Poli38472_010143 [Pythium oligandrum]|uniref:cysteine desulfurase n=1 Tax=Pythium oligandrum TaxID=41045 RepID=A0A8K1C8E6_PYTOL|nr:hypothetical protein Poli38472_010143 [Pythium oligandrum]|eukprot:TMW58584.1 hypothetical protein Poli38472_010143 [Pythium oligandrum]